MPVVDLSTRESRLNYLLCDLPALDDFAIRNIHSGMHSVIPAAARGGGYLTHHQACNAASSKIPATFKLYRVSIQHGPRKPRESDAN